MNLNQIKEKYLRAFIVSVTIGIIWYFADLDPEISFMDKSFVSIGITVLLSIAILIVVTFICVLILKAVYEVLYDFFVVTKWKKNERAYYVIALVVFITLFTAACITRI
jgi:hypothetical protein